MSTDHRQDNDALVDLVLVSEEPSEPTAGPATSANRSPTANRITQQSGPGSAACGAVRCQHTANLAVDLLMALLEERAGAHSGWLPINEVRALIDEFKKAPGELRRFYERTYDDCSASQDEVSPHEFDQWDAFEHLLAEALTAAPDRDAADDTVRQDERRLPPRAVPPLVRTLTCLLGRGFVRRTRAACDELEQEARRRHAGSFSWEAFARSDGAKSLLLRTMLRLTETLESPETGGHRIIELVNTDLGNMRVVSGVYQPGPPVVFTTGHFQQALANLFMKAPDTAGAFTPRRGERIAPSDRRRLNDFRRYFIS